MKGYRSPAAVAGHVNLQAQNVPELPLQGRNIGVGRLSLPPRASLGYCISQPGLAPLRQRFRLPDRETLGHDFLDERFGVRGRCNRTRMAHADIATQ